MRRKGRTSSIESAGTASGIYGTAPWRGLVHCAEQDAAGGLYTYFVASATSVFISTSRMRVCGSEVGARGWPEAGKTCMQVSKESTDRLEQRNRP